MDLNMNIPPSSTAISLPELLIRIRNLDKIRNEAIQDLQVLFSNANCVNYSQMCQLDFGKPYRLGPGCTTTRVKQGRGGLLFVVVFDYDNAQIYPHSHNCIEWVQIISGQIEDLETGNVAYGGDTVKILPGVKHHVIGHRNTVLFVEFRRPSIFSRIAKAFRK